MRICDLANELGAKGTEIVSFLNDRGGEEIKSTQKVLDDASVALVRKQFGNAKAEKKAPKAEGGAGKTEKVEAVKNTEAGNPQKPAKNPEVQAKPPQKPPAPKTSAAEETPIGEGPAREAETRREEKPRREEEPRRRKKIIINLNPENSGGGSGGGRGRNDRFAATLSSSHGRGGMRPGGRDIPHKIIKPLTAPSMPESVQLERRPIPQPKRRPPESVDKAVENETTAGLAEETKKAPPQGEGRSREGAPQRGDRPAQRIAPEGQRGAPAAPRDGSPRRGDRPRPAQAGSTAPREGRPPRSGDRPYPPRPDGPRRSDGVQRVASPNYSSDRRPPRTDRPPRAGERPDGRSRSTPDGRPRSPGRPGSGRSGARAGGKPGEVNKHQEAKRSQLTDRDRRSKKEFRFVDEDALANTRQRRVGAFQRPVKPVGSVAEEQIKVITLAEVLTIKELAEKMKIAPSGIIKKLFLQGKIVNVNTEITYEEAENIAIEYEIICEPEVKVDIIEELLKEEDEIAEEMVKRSPIICVMGHVDHGKTSLLDAIRETRVIDKESGGITQHIGAYTVDVNDQSITFLDTPGHEAFTAMRMRGAVATDIAILVIAADDGVMPQTAEAISHAKAAGIEIVVAINKIDKPSANIDRVKQEMTEYELVPTDWGGQTEFVPVSAKTGEGLETLLETIILTADIMELKANPNRQARGLVIEAELDKGRGPVATVLVQKGTLHVGDFISAGACYGKVRAMIDDKGQRVK
ncbi:MAG: translation initiation factor IF-2, partial [Lachnospiraceae bacterium]|nr:translation initiation factor IF-2 [Lachnospiraceae bacterium]